MYNKSLLVCEQTASRVDETCIYAIDNNSSMYSDILKGHRTEIDFINGYLVKEARKAGISVPLNEHITQMIKAKEELICH